MSSTVPSPKSIPRQTSVRADELSSSDFWHGKKGWKSRENKTGGGAKNHSEDLIGSFWDGDAQKALYGILFRRFLFRNTSFSSEILKSMIIIELVCSWNLISTVIGITKPPPKEGACSVLLHTLCPKNNCFFSKARCALKNWPIFNFFSVNDH